MTIFQRTVGEVADDHCVLSGGCSEASARRACKGKPPAGAEIIRRRVRDAVTTLSPDRHDLSRAYSSKGRLRV